MSGRHEAYFKAQREHDDREQERREYNAMEERVAQCEADIAELVAASQDIANRSQIAAESFISDDQPGVSTAFMADLYTELVHFRALLAKHKGG